MKFKLEKSPLTLGENLKAFARGAPKGIVYGLAVLKASDLAQLVGDAINTRMGINYADETIIYGSCASVVGYCAYKTYTLLRAQHKKRAQERAQFLANPEEFLRNSRSD